jgi:hypothetical protein
MEQEIPVWVIKLIFCIAGFGLGWIAADIYRMIKEPR